MEGGVKGMCSHSLSYSRHSGEGGAQEMMRAPGDPPTHTCMSTHICHRQGRPTAQMQTPTDQKGRGLLDLQPNPPEETEVRVPGVLGFGPETCTFCHLHLARVQG